LQDQTQDDVLRSLAFDPTPAASAIPVVDFGFILGVVLGCGLIADLGITWSSDFPYQNDNASGPRCAIAAAPLEIFPKKICYAPLCSVARA
jgi:hypothetical protein